MRRYDQRLGLIVADDTDTAVAAHLGDVSLEFRPELRGRDVVDEPRVGFRVPYGETASTRAEVRVIICAVKQVGDAILVRDCSK